MLDLYALQGVANCGKSQTINLLYQRLRTKYPTATIQSMHSWLVDVSGIMSGVNGMVVGIESQGDPNSRLKNSLGAFAAANCDVIFCACRTRGMTIGWVNWLSPPYHIHFVTKPPVAHNHAGANAAMAALLLKQAGL